MLSNDDDNNSKMDLEKDNNLIILNGIDDVNALENDMLNNVKDKCVESFNLSKKIINDMKLTHRSHILDKISDFEDDFNKELIKYIKEPLENQINELKSNIHNMQHELKEIKSLLIKNNTAALELNQELIRNSIIKEPLQSSADWDTNNPEKVKEREKIDKNKKDKKDVIIDTHDDEYFILSGNTYHIRAKIKSSAVTKNTAWLDDKKAWLFPKDDIDILLKTFDENTIKYIQKYSQKDKLDTDT